MKNLILLVLMTCITTYTSFAQGNNIFRTDKVHEVRFISYKSTDWASIQQRFDQKEYTPMKVVINGETIDSVGIRIKGNNYRPKDGKFQAFKIDMNEYVKGQKLDGLKKINLNNRDIMPNHLAYQMCRENDIVAPRTAFAKLYFDDKYIGNYMLLEQIDKTFLKQHFGNKDGNLYKASGKGAYLEYKGPKKEDYYYAFEKKTHEEENDYSDLLAMLNFFTHSSDQDFEGKLNEKIDFASFIKAISIEMLVSKKDAFYDAGRNFYFYFNTETKKFVYIPDDFDYSFESFVDFKFKNVKSFDPKDDPFMQRVLKSNILQNQYFANTCAILNTYFKSEKLNQSIDNLLQFANSNNYSFFDFARITSQQIKNYLSTRIQYIEEEFGKENYSCNASSITTRDDHTFSIFPNPVTDKLTIELTNYEQTYTIELCDILGNTILKKNNIKSSAIINMESYKAGMYILRTTSGDKARVQKIVKQ